MKINLIDMKGEFETQPSQKPRYQSPTVFTYQTQTLMRQLGPARAYSSNQSLDDALLFPDHHP